MYGRTLLLIALSVVVLWVVLGFGPRIAPASAASEWTIEANAPLLIGSARDPFVYAGGDALRAMEGRATLRLAPDQLAGSLQIEFRLPASNEEGLPFDAAPGGHVVVYAMFGDGDTFWIDTEIFGNTGIGERRLPQTHAMLAGKSSFDVTVDSASSAATIHGFWAVADALRKEGGTIRQQGLVFSPLLREKTGFSDPSRTELTLLLYEEAEEGEALVQLHVVFASVNVSSPPSDT